MQIRTMNELGWLPGLRGGLTVADSVAQWFDDHVGREDAHAHRVLSTAKMITTFSAAIAATFVVTALQGGHTSNWDKAATVAMALSAIAVFYVVFRTRETTPDLNRCAMLGAGPEDPNPDSALRQLRADMAQLAERNVSKAARVQQVTVGQVLLSIIASGLAIKDLLTTTTCN